MKIPRIGNCELGTVPRTAAIVDDFFPPSEIKKLKKLGTDLLEIRVDNFKGDIDKVCDYIGKIRKAASLPLIGTIRENERNRKNRIDLFAKIIPLVDAIDVEIDSSINKKIIAMAAGKTIIVSEHDFLGTPDSTRFSRIVKDAFDMGGHIVKIAATANCRKDVVRFLDLIRDCKKPIVAFSMGDFGSISRIMSMLYGSLYTYGFVKKANAPGQIPIGELIALLRRFFPELR